MRLIPPILLVLAMAGCSSMGLAKPALRDSMDFGPPQTVKLCVCLDRGVSEQRARELLGSWRSEQDYYGLYIEAASFMRMPRPGFFYSTIIEDFMKMPLPPGCDRMIYFVRRTFGDFVWGNLPFVTGVPLPEVLGAVNDETLTHAFVYANTNTLNQIVMTPYSTTRHELYHLLGCRRHFDMAQCYRDIQTLKRASAMAAKEQEGEGARFYASFAETEEGEKLLATRRQVNDALGFELLPPASQAMGGKAAETGG